MPSETGARETRAKLADWIESISLRGFESIVGEITKNDDGREVFTISAVMRQRGGKP